MSIDEPSKQAERELQFKRAMLAHDLRLAWKIIRQGKPRDATERERAFWSARRQMLKWLDGWY